MNKNLFLKYIDSIKALAHMLIAGVAFVGAKNLALQISFTDGTKSLKVGIPKLLRMRENFNIKDFDHTFEYVFPLEPAAQILESPDREKMIAVFFDLSLQIPITRTFELIKSYCKQTKPEQSNNFKKQDWYLVSWAIRNCFSHDFNIVVYGKKLKKLPFKWKNIKITKNMLGKPLSYKDVSIKDFTNLFNEMCAFAKTLD